MRRSDGKRFECDSFREHVTKHINRITGQSLNLLQNIRMAFVHQDEMMRKIQH